ncbi:MAG: sigma-70 family RNA polymerase sigma factor [Pirellulaceae bacterium]
MNRTEDGMDAECESQLYEQFLGRFVQDQLRVFSYILALVHDRNDADDIFQETSLVLWREYGSYQPDREFLPWALGVARNQVLKFWRTRKGDRHVYSEVLVEQLADDALDIALENEPRRRALRECVKQLTGRQRQLIELFYGKNLAAMAIADAWDRSVFTVYKALKVLRRSLLRCIESRLVEEEL